MYFITVCIVLMVPLVYLTEKLAPNSSIHCFLAIVTERGEAA